MKVKFFNFDEIDSELPVSNFEKLKSKRLENKQNDKRNKPKRGFNRTIEQD